MRVINGKRVRQMAAAAIAAWAAQYPDLTIDLGAGDGRFVRDLAIENPERGAIALDLCEANMRAASRTAPDNALFVVGDALALPDELQGRATRITMHFPWGSLQRGLVGGNPEFLAGLQALVNGHAELDLLVNGGALAEIGWSLELGGDLIRHALRRIRAEVGEPRRIDAQELRHYPTTWAKRLAFGRDPRAVRIVARLRGSGAAIASIPARKPDRAPASREPERRSPVRAGAFPGAG